MNHAVVRAIALAASLAFGSAHVHAQVVQRYEGNGLQNLRPFTVGDNWEVRWNARGDFFSLNLHDADGNLVDLNANQSGPGSGTTFVPRGGRFYYQVNAIGGWELEIVQLDPSTFPTITGAGRTFTGNGAGSIRPFTVTGPWEVTWDARGDFFSLYLNDAQGNLVDLSANQAGPGRGSSYHPRPGTYYFTSNSIGAWTITIAPVD